MSTGPSSDQLPQPPKKSMPFGYVVAVEGAKIAAVISNVRGKDENGQQKNFEVQIGAMVKIPTSRTFAFGMITSLSVPGILQGNSKAVETRVMKIELLGESLKSNNDHIQFERGISIYPALWAPIYISQNEDLAQIYARPNEPNIRIGALHQDPSIPAYMLIDRMLGMHFAILGTTGAGKSCSVALILRTILESYSQGRILLMDPHNEYAAAFEDIAEVMNTNNLDLPYWLLNADESIEAFIDSDSPTYNRECALLREGMALAKISYNRDSLDEGSITADSPVPYQIRDLLIWIDERMGDLEQPDGVGPYMRLKTKIQTMRLDQRYRFMFPTLQVIDNMADIIGRIIRLPVRGKPISIFDLSGVPSEIVDVVVSVLCRLIFDFAVWSSTKNISAPLLLVCEEAHRYIPNEKENKSKRFAPTRELISRIAQEGRKYGVSLGLITQRPALISETILSQCNTLIALRMSNDTDQAFVKKAVPETAFGLMGALPALRRAEAVISGEGVSLPMRVKFSNLPEHYRPRSETQSYTDQWAKDSWTSEKVDQVLDAWRRQQRGRTSKKKPKSLSSLHSHESFDPSHKPRQR